MLKLSAVAKAIHEMDDYSDEEIERAHPAVIEKMELALTQHEQSAGDRDPLEIYLKELLRELERGRR